MKGSQQMTNENGMSIRTVVILSGGQDSTTCLYWAIQQFHGAKHVAAVTFDYQQLHRREIEAATIIAKMAAIASHEVIPLGPVLHGTSPLVTNDLDSLETYKDYNEMNEVIGSRIERTFVPMRNALFITIAANRAIALGAQSLVTGVCEMDNANYPDCRDDFIYSQVKSINLALGNETNSFQIYAPLMFMSKAETIGLATRLPGCMEALAYSHTAYDGGYPPTSKDHASTLRAQGFLEAMVPDPLVVRAWREGLMPLPGSPNYDRLREGAGQPPNDRETPVP